MPGFFEKQLENCGVEYFDYYLLHSLDEGAAKQAEEWGAFDFMLEKKAKGLVKHVGFSFHDKAEVLDKILTRHPKMEYVQLQLNYADWEDSEVQSRKCYEVCVKYGKPVSGYGAHQRRHAGECSSRGRSTVKGRQTGNVCGILGHPFCCIPGKCIYGTERYER